MRLPNRTGTITKLSGKRRKPWQAKRFVGWKVDDEKRTMRPVYRSIGTFAKKSEAMKALMKAAQSPEEKQKTYTLADVYAEWSERKYADVGEGMQRSYTNAWNYLAPLHSAKIADLTVSDFELVVERANVPRTVRSTVQILLNGIYNYAIAHDYTAKDVSAFTNFRADTKAKIVRKVFTPTEVKQLFTSDNVKDQMILVAIYTGMRPNELIGLRNDEVDMENEYLRIRGSKTESGHLRDIPLHPDILPIIKANCLKSAELNAREVFLSVRKKPYSYDTFYEYVDGKGHTPHDTRHSFVTYARRSGMDQLAVKKIVGHKTNRDVTEDVYTHVDDEFLQREMEKFKVE